MTIEIPAGLSTRIRWRLAIPTILFMFLSSLDRVNVSFAAMQMNADLGFSPTEYGFGASVLFAGFLLGQLPSVMLLQRIGFSRWLGGLALLWGVAATSMSLIQTQEQFYLLRIIIGLAEGGLAPGIVLYLSQFATERERATTFALPMLAIPLSVVLGGPISGWLLDMTGPGDMPGWRWMFLAEGLPTIAMGIAAFLYFPDKPKDARWLTEADRTYLAARAANQPIEKVANDWSVLFSPVVILSALLWFCLLSGSYGIMFWLPQMVHSMTSLSGFEIGLVTALPWIGNGLAVYFNSAHSDKTGERFWHVGLPALIAGAALPAAMLVGPSAVGLAFLIVAASALGAAQGAFWSLPTTVFGPRTFAVGAVAINIFGTAGGAVIPHAIGAVREATGAFTLPTLMLGAVLLFACVPVLIIRAIQRGGSAQVAA